MEKFELKSSVCTSIAQSKRLLELGLKKETADMVYIPHYKDERLYCYFDAQVLNDYISQYMFTDPSFVDYIPAWSLHRLLLLLNCSYIELDANNPFEDCITRIEFMIKENKIFNQDYLEEKL